MINKYDKKESATLVASKIICTTQLISIIQKKSKSLLLSRGRCKQRFFSVSKNSNKPTPLSVGKTQEFFDNYKYIKFPLNKIEIL